MNLLAKLMQRASRRALAGRIDDDNARAVRATTLFADLSPPALLLVLNRLIERRYRRHEVIFREGNPGICLFLVRDGKVEIYTEDTDPDDPEAAPVHRTVYATVTAGRIFGEMATLYLRTRTTSARAAEPDTVLLTLSSYDLEEIMERYPTDGLYLLRGITDTIARNLVAANKQLRENQTELAALRAQVKQHE